MSVILLYCSDQSGFSTLGQMTLYYNHVFTIIIATIDIVTVCYFMDHCDYFPCREYYVLVIDFIITMIPETFPRALVAGAWKPASLSLGSGSVRSWILQENQRYRVDF